MELSRSQLFALEYISKYAENEKREAKATINHILNMSNITDEIFEEAVANLKSHARISFTLSSRQTRFEYEKYC